MSEKLPKMPEPHNLGRSLVGGVPEAWQPLFTASQVLSLQRDTWMRAMEVAAKETKERAENVRKSNTYRGRVNQSAQFAADQLEFAADVLRALPMPEGGE
jgi:hypothetical protein